MEELQEGCLRLELLLKSQRRCGTPIGRRDNGTDTDTERVPRDPVIRGCLELLDWMLALAWGRWQGPEMGQPHQGATEPCSW